MGLAPLRRRVEEEMAKKLGDVRFDFSVSQEQLTFSIWDFFAMAVTSFVWIVGASLSCSDVMHCNPELKAYFMTFFAATT